MAGKAFFTTRENGSMQVRRKHEEKIQVIWALLKYRDSRSDVELLD